MAKQKENKNLCDHIDRVAVHPSIKFGGASIGKCEREVLPGMTCCAQHATREALGYWIRELAKRLAKHGERV